MSKSSQYALMYIYGVSYCWRLHGL